MMRGMLGVFAELDSTVEAIAELRQKKVGDVTVYSPTPQHVLEEAVDAPESVAARVAGSNGETAQPMSANAHCDANVSRSRSNRTAPRRRCA